MTSPRPSFWRRQAGPEPTVGQYVFDILFGLLLPIACLAADPVVFVSRSALGGRGFLAGYAVFAYVLVGLQLAALAVWLLVGRRVRAAGAWFAGPLAAGAFFAFGVGVVLFPLSFIGMLVLIGFLGYTPFLTSFVFLRNALRAHGRSWAAVGTGRRRLLLAAGLVCALLPAVAADRAAVAAADAALARPEAVEAWALPLLDADRIAFAWEEAPEGPRRLALASLYRRCTGGDVESRLATLRD